VFAPAVILGIEHHSQYLFEEEPVALCKTIYGSNPFPESIEVARFIENNSTAADKVAVLGSEPQIYFYSGRRSATGYIYVYSLMEIHEYSLTMQKEMAGEIERSNPKFIVLVNVAASWLVHPGSEQFIFQWANSYVPEHYNLVGIADIVAPVYTVYKWYDDARNYGYRSTANLLVFQRR
jgi:hypothetical protein